MIDLTSSYALHDQGEGTLRVLLWDPVTGRVVDSRTTKNIITYRAADIMAKAVVGDTAYKLSHIYFQWGETVPTPGGFTPGAPSGLPAAARTDDMATLTAGTLTTDAEEQIISIGYSATPDVPGRYQHNMVTVTAVAGNPALDNKTFVGAGLIARVNGVDNLFAHQIYIGLEKLPQFQVVASWTIRLL